MDCMPSEGSPAPTPTPKPYLHLYQTQGGLFTFPPPTSTLTSIGTSGCQTCLCIYIPLSPTQCFAAHAVAHIGLDNSRQPPPSDDESTWVPTPQQGRGLKEFVVGKLEGREELKGLDVGGEVWKERSKRAVVCCPDLFWGGDTNKPATGWYLLEAFKEFFNLPDLKPDEIMHGFVVDHIAGTQELFEISPFLDEARKDISHPGPEEYESGWKRVNEEEPDLEEEVGEWGFGYLNGQWSQVVPRGEAGS